MLSRLALRIGVCEALAPTGAAAFPTIAGRFVYDSQLDHIEKIEALGGQPSLVVYTDDQHDHQYGSGNTHPDNIVVTLCVDVLIATGGQVKVAQPDGSVEVLDVTEIAESDPQREALLDLLEAQVRRVLDSRNHAPTYGALAALIFGVAEMESTPFRDSDRNVRLAARALRMKVKIKGDAWPPPNTTAPAGLDGLPEPLRTMALQLPEGAPHRAFCAQIASALGPAPLMPLLTGVDMRVAEGRVPTDEDFDLRAAAP